MLVGSTELIAPMPVSLITARQSQQLPKILINCQKSQIPREYEELRHQGSHVDALKAAAKTELPISDEARRLNRARAR
jgi:hypothetical protein